MKKIPLFVILFFSFFSCEKYSMDNHFKVIAHRGYWELADGADNSIMSLVEAVRLGVDGVELDICKTKDDSLVVIHGLYHGDYYIPETDYKDLKKIILSNGEEISTFREYMKEAVKYDILYFVELKTKGEESDVLQILNQYNLQYKIRFSSFSSEICETLLKKDANLNVAYINGDKSPRELKDKGYSGMNYEISVWKKHSDWIDEAKSLGLELSAWVVKTESDIIWCSTHGINYLITDSPLEAIHFRSNYE